MKYQNNIPARPARFWQAAGAALFLLLGGLAAGATDDLAFIVGGNSITFAEEIFAGDANNRFLGRGDIPHIIEDTGIMTVELRVREGTGLSVGAIGTITFTLREGLRYGNAPLYGDYANQHEYELPAVDIINLRFREADGDGAQLSIVLQSGGRVIDDSVTFLLTAVAAGRGSHVMEPGDTLTFMVPSVWNVAHLGTATDSVLMDIDVRPQIHIPGANFPAFSATKEILRTTNRFTLHTLPGIPAKADRTDLGNLIEGGVEVSAAGRRSQAVIIGRIGFTEHEPAKGRRGVNDHALIGGDMFTITLEGNFYPQDRVFIDLDNDFYMADFEPIPIREGRTYHGYAYQLGFLRDSIKNVYLVRPEGDWSVGDYRVGFSVDFEIIRNFDEGGVTPPTSVSVDGLQMVGSVHGVPSCLGSDRTRILVTNEAGTDVNLWVDGYDAEGTRFGLRTLDVSIPRAYGGVALAPRETVVVQSRHLEQLYGFNAGLFGLGFACTVADTWEGRARFSFFTEGGKVSLTPLVLTGDGVLLPWADMREANND